MYSCLKLLCVFLQEPHNGDLAAHITDSEEFLELKTKYQEGLETIKQLRTENNQIPILEHQVKYRKL